MFTLAVTHDGNGGSFSKLTAPAECTQNDMMGLLFQDTRDIFFVQNYYRYNK